MVGADGVGGGGDCGGGGDSGGGDDTPMMGGCGDMGAGEGGGLWDVWGDICGAPTEEASNDILWDDLDLVCGYI